MDAFGTLWQILKYWHKARKLLKNIEKILKKYWKILKYWHKAWPLCRYSFFHALFFRTRATKATPVLGCRATVSAIRFLMTWKLDFLQGDQIVQFSTIGRLFTLGSVEYSNSWQNFHYKSYVKILIKWIGQYYGDFFTNISGRLACKGIFVWIICELKIASW
jgi:hypothetical protein